MQPTFSPVSIKKFSHATVSISESNFISVKKKCNLRLFWYSKKPAGS